MSPALSDLKRLVTDNREALARQIAASAAESPADPQAAVMTSTDVEQMIHGFFALLLQGLEGTDAELRGFYLDSVVVGVRDAGTPIDMMIGGSAKSLLMMTAQIALELPEASRSEALVWLSTYLGKYLGDMATVMAAR